MSILDQVGEVPPPQSKPAELLVNFQEAPPTPRIPSKQAPNDARSKHMFISPSPMVRLRMFAEFAGVDPKTAMKWCRDGRVPGAVQLGRLWLIPRSTLDGLAEGSLSIKADR